MSGISTFQPFLIGAGESKTGLFQYLESWIKPEDAFDDIQDAYVNRGRIWKRNGQTLFGRMKYCTTQVLTHGTGGVGPYSGTMDNTTNTPRGGHLPITASSVTIRTRVTTPATEVYTSDALGNLVGSLGGVGTINYTTGAWSITSAINVVNNTPIMMTYGFEPTTASNPHTIVSVVAVGTGALTAAGTYSQNLPIEPNTVFVVAVQSNGTETYTDNGAGVLTGTIAGTGTINYSTGAWAIDPAGAATITTGTSIQLGFKPAYLSQTQYVVQVKVGTTTTASGVINNTIPVFDLLPLTPGEVVIVATQSNGTETYKDIAGLGTLVGNLAGTGTINYTTGAWSIDPSGANTITNATNILMGISGKSLFGIMGINQWNDETNNTFKVTVEDTRRLSVYNQTSSAFDPVCDVAETLYISDGATLTYTNSVTGYTPTFALIAPLSVTITTVNPVTGAVINTTVDNGVGGIVASGNIASGTINYYTGAISVTFTAPEPQGTAVNATFKLQNDYFFGDNSNFFNWTNWYYPTNLIPTELQQLDGTIVIRPTQFHDGFLYLTNNFDPITLFNGTTLSRPAFAIQQAQLGLGKNEITKCLDIKTYASRLIFIRPSTTNNNSLPDPQSIRWSAQFQPTNTVADIPGSGGELSAATSDWIQSAKFLKDFLIVNFQNSTWNFRFTGNSFNPFVFYKIDTTKTTNAPYGTIEYDDKTTSMGTKGLITCDGNSVDRYDIKVFDLYNDINSEVFKQCFGLRFDALNQAWMLYPNSDTDEQLSSNIFLYNYMEDSWSIFNMPLSCVGLGFGMQDTTWAALPIAWQDSDDAWNSYLNQQESLRLLGGGHTGLILQLNDGETDNGVAINMQFTTKKYNPFVDQGVKAQFGYLDVYYTTSTDIADPVELTFDFFIDNNTSIAFTRTIELVPNDGNEDPNYPFAWQRLYINVQAQFLQYKCRDNGVGGFQILGMLLWASPAGRLIQ